jgi:ribosomal protein L11 methyltransferase
MPLFKLRIEAADLRSGERAAGLLGTPPAPDALAVTLFELKPPAFVVEAYYDREPPLERIAHVLDGEQARLGAPMLESVPDTNWVALSQSALPPVRAGRFVVHGSHDRAPFAMRRTAVEIEAGEAFGTGHNATTALCLEMLDGLLRQRRFGRVLDLGCGSGVIAIAAARALPDARVTASDNDPVATAIAALNRVAQRVRILEAGGFDHAALRCAGAFDLVVANILPGVLIALAPAMRRRTARGGIAILSGLLAHQVGEVLATYRAQGFRLVRRAQRSQWAALALLNTGS